MIPRGVETALVIHDKPDGDLWVGTILGLNVLKKNGEVIDNFKVEDRDVFEILPFKVEHLFSEEELKNNTIKFLVNGKELSIELPQKEIRVNNKIVSSILIFVF